MKFTKLNLNPSGKKRADCVVRAIIKATGFSWLQVYKELCILGELKFSMPNCKEVYGEWLEMHGFIKHLMPKFPDNSRYTVQEFADKFNKGTYIISVAKHLTVVIDGELFDTWNCSHKSVGNYWTK